MYFITKIINDLCYIINIVITIITSLLNQNIFHELQMVGQDASEWIRFLFAKLIGRKI